MRDIYDSFIFNSKADFVIGIDEVGWGAIAGPVVIGCAVYAQEFFHHAVKDSKAFTTERAREKALAFVRDSALWLATETVSVNAISSLGAGAAMQAGLYTLALKALERFPAASAIVLDGSNTIKGLNHPQIAIPKADAFVTAVSAASILAKVERDQYMNEVYKEYPEYEWNQNKGYATERHTRLLREHGVSLYHRLNIPMVCDVLKKKGTYEELHMIGGES